MHYCIHNIYNEYYTTQWNFICFSKLGHTTVTSQTQKWMRVVETIRRFCHFLLWRGEVDLVSNFDPKKMTLNYNALAKSIISYLGVSFYFPFVFFLTVYNYVIYRQKLHAVMSLERAHSITWYKQKRRGIGERQNRWHEEVRTLVSNQSL